MDESQPIENRPENGERNPDGTFSTGNPGGPGRPAGTPNRNSRAIVEAVLEAFDRKGAVEYLMRLDDAEFVRLVSRVLPREIAARVDVADVTGEVAALADRSEAALRELIGPDRLAEIERERQARKGGEVST